MGRYVDVGMAVIDTTIGAITSNADKVIGAMRELGDCTVVCFPEMTLSGYPPEDLVLWKGFLDHQWRELCRIREESQKHRAVFVVGLAVCHLNNLYNCAAVVEGGKIHGIVPKCKLPTYNIFYEQRTFSGGLPYWTDAVDGVPFGDLVFNFGFGVLGVEICEDMWSPVGPMSRRAFCGAELILNLSASPFRIGFDQTRREVISTRASDNQATVVYVNHLGGNGAIIYDGGAYINQNGKMLYGAPRWQGGHFRCTVDLARTQRLRKENTTWRNDFSEYQSRGQRVATVECGGPQALADAKNFAFPKNKNFFLPEDACRKTPSEEFFEELTNATLTALEGYFKKTGAFKCILIALSGGRDSVLTLALSWLWAKKRFGDDASKIQNFIRCYSMPTRFNSSQTRNISKNLASALGVDFLEQSIEEEFELELKNLQRMLKPGEEIPKLARQNIQARLRGERMMNIANSVGGMWIQTSNMSEKFAGYTTVGGDQMGAFSLISNLPKTVVIAFLDYLNKTYGMALDDAIAQVSSAELEDNQEDERDLLPFPLWDACLYLVLEEKMVAAEVLEVLKAHWTDAELAALWPGYAPGMLDAAVDKLFHAFFRSIFKWVVAPEGAHLGKLDLDRERTFQLPVVQSPEWFFPPQGGVL